MRLRSESEGRLGVLGELGETPARRAGDKAPESPLLRIARLLAGAMWTPVPKDQTFSPCRLRVIVRLARRLVELADEEAKHGCRSQM